MDIAAWLRGLGLEQYARLFRDNDIDGEILGGMNAEDLKELGISSFGHRRRLLNAIAALAGEPLTHDVAQSATSVTSAPTPPPTVDAERRQLTVMFCDLVGSTALSTRHDPEDLRELIGDYHRAVRETAGRFDGFVAKYMGDGVLIYFGYPQAHEDDAERAVRAGLAVIETIGGLPARDDLSVRLGVATGLAVVGDLIGEGAAQERGVVGETPNLAARLQGLASPNTLVIAEATRRQVGGLFHLADLGPQALAGFAEPQPAWRVIGESGMLSRFEALRSGETPLVGREEEVELLIRRWQQAKSGEGRVVLISGEPGIGKSRLTVALSEHIGAEPHTRLRYFCSPYHQDSALHPFIAQLERAAGFARDDAVQAKLAKLQALLVPGARDDDDIALLSELLSLPSSAADLNLSPQRKREKLFEALLNQLEAVTRHRPVLMVFEDAHWIDPTSRELLDLTVDRLRRLPVLLMITFRPEFRPPWGDRSHVTSLALNRLGERDSEALVQRLAGNAALTSDIVAEIVERTDGVPLFVEELTKAVLESATQRDRVAAVLGTTSFAAQSVPATLHASLMARLDRLGPAAKEIAQIAAVLGRAFAYELIEPVAQRPQKELQAALDQLSEAGLLFCRGTAPHASYLFKHALVQDAAYSTLLRGRRQELHARVAAALEAHFADLVERQPELLAHHLTAAGLPAQAIIYWHRAGERAVQRTANQEAIAHLRTALAQLGQFPDTPERAKQELALQRLLGQASFANKGYASPDAGSAFSRARELCAAIGDDGSIYPVLFGIWLFQQTGAYHTNAQATANEILERAGRTNNTGARIAGNLAVGLSALHLGTLVQARSHLDKAIEYYRTLTEEEATRLTYAYGIELGAPCCVYAAWCWWLLGYPDQALPLGDEGLAIVERIGHDYSRSRGHYWYSAFHAYRREWPIVEERAAAAIASARERGLAMVVAAGRIMQGAARAMLDPRDEHVADIREALADYRATGARFQNTHHLILLAQALGACGHCGDGLAALREAAALVEETGERYVEAEIHRLEGNLLLAENNPAEAEPCYVKALEVARAQEARSLELRAACDLARLWAERGERAWGADLLAPVYGWFTEGFDTADLIEAKALLEELA
jgi:class 3 adenylate cyclase/predicted ATPase